jgi:hypothetical protein
MRNLYKKRNLPYHKGVYPSLLTLKAGDNMFRIYPDEVPRSLTSYQIQGLCPHCEKGTTYTLVSHPLPHIIESKGIKIFVASYACDLCLGSNGPLRTSPTLRLLSPSPKKLFPTAKALYSNMFRPRFKKKSQRL